MLSYWITPTPMQSYLGSIADDESAAVSYLQGTALVAAHPDKFARCFRRHGGDGEGCCKDYCRQCADFLDHITSHRQMWNTWKHWFQRVPESR